jgi:uncharacterized RDD family membrane protein YckC
MRVSSFVLYCLLFEWPPLEGSVGKLVVGIKVGEEYGARISFGNSLLKCIARGVTLATLFLGYFTTPYRNDNRALHDLMSSTYALKRNKLV